MDLSPALAQAFDHTHRVIAGVRPEQMDNATPCSEWDVRALLDHTIGVVARIGAAIVGERPQADGNTFALADDVASQFRALADSTLEAWRAVDLDGHVDIGAGPMPGNAALGINLLDTATHSWDIARATGQREDLPDDLAALILGICQGFVTDEIRAFAGFGPALEVEPTASATNRLVAFLGRQP